jgi:RNA polymerase sigma-B factor
VTELPSGANAWVDAVDRNSHPVSTGRGVDRAHAKELFQRFASTGDAALREQLVGIHLPLVEYLARRFRNRGEPLEDLVQVGTIGLLKAIDRFDLDREVEFSTYATPTIVGELKRHFRDKGWAVRVPRRLQELNLSLTKVVAELSQEIGRSPTVREIADRMHLSEDEVLEGLDTSNAYAVISLDAPAGGEDTPSVSEHIGVEDETLETLEYRAALGPIIAELPERERRILYLRFFRGMTQSQIADRLGISQMHVSRLLNRTLVMLRDRLLRDDGD